MHLRQVRRDSSIRQVKANAEDPLGRCLACLASPLENGNVPATPSSTVLQLQTSQEIIEVPGSLLSAEEHVPNARQASTLLLHGGHFPL